MKKTLLAIALAAFVPWVSAAQPFCDTESIHPIDARFEHDMQQSGGVSANMRDAQSKAYASWDGELNREYRELMALLSAEEKAALRAAQRAWLAFRDAEISFFWSESISGGGTLQPIIISDQAMALLKARVCQLARYKTFTETP